MNTTYHHILSTIQAIPPCTLAVIGLGNENRADDGFGIALASGLKDRFPDQVYSEKERSVEALVFDLLDREDIETILFVDVADFGGIPGEISLFNIESVEQFVPPVSTHKVPMTFLMNLVNQRNKTSFILGVQPISLTFMDKMSEPIHELLGILNEFFDRLLRPPN
jgi:hydrogenase maturation protease